MQFFDPLSPEDAFAELRALVASPERITAVRSAMLIELVQYLQSRGPNPRVVARFSPHELRISLHHPHRVVTVWIDWQDYGEGRDGLPMMYYRVQINRSDSPLSDNHRVATTVEAACLIITA
jgi:hypothetical protein